MSPSRAAPRRGAGPAAGTQALAQGASPRPRRGRVAPARYRILGRPVTLESDSPELLRVFDQDYAWFREEGDRAGRPIHFTVRLRAGEGSELRMWDGPADGRPPRCRHPLAGQADAVMAVYRLLLRELFNALDEFVLLHAGVLATDDAALLLAGPPGVGKTTLVLALVEAGLRFFSDDFCPIERVSRLVHPFPRSAWVVGKPRAGEAAARVRKRPVSILGHGRTAEDRRPRPPGWVVLLDGGDATRHLCSLELAVAPGARPSLAREFAGLGAEVRVELPGKRRSRLRVAYPPGMGLATAVRRLLERRGGEIRDVYRDDAVRPDFDRTPVLHPVPRHETAFSLLADLKQSEWSRLGTRGAPGSPARLLMELADLLGDASCHRLRVGRLGETRDLLLRLVAGPAPARSRP